MSRIRAALLCVVVTAVITSSFVSLAPARAQTSTERSHFSTHFSITWESDPASPDAPDARDADFDGIPDTISRLLAAFERAWALEVDQLGYQPPPNEDRYPLYVAALNRGFMQPLFLDDQPSQPSYILVPVRYARDGIADPAVTTFAVHEFHHAIQAGYDVYENHWIGEATSAWLEELLLDDLNRNHFFLRFFVPAPEVPLRLTGTEQEYGAFLFLEFLVETLGARNGVGPELIRELWETMASTEGAVGLDSLEAIEELALRYGSNPGDVWGEFLLWRWRLDHFKEGDAYKAELADLDWPRVASVTRFGPESCVLGPTIPMSPYTGHYAAVRPAATLPTHANGFLTVQGPPGTGGFALIRPRNGQTIELLLDFDDEGVARLPLGVGKDQLRRLTLGVGRTLGPPLDPTSLVPPVGVVNYSIRLPSESSTRLVSVDVPERASVFLSSTISGSVTCGGKPAPFIDIEITARDTGTGAEDVTMLHTGLDGSFSLIVNPQATTTFEIAVVDPLVSIPPPETRVLQVETEISLVLSNRVLLEGDILSVFGEIVPLHAGAQIDIEIRRPERAWRVIASAVTDESGGYSASFALSARGVWEVRARVTSTGDADHLPGTSLTKLIKVGRE
ncbi:MAG TPA: hypothetical protein VNC78_08805 [Actinomycetota bacterium]|nr:hypothetical protein [Actinomycetota bacterium]